MKHINVALFVPDEGCPHRCSFCNQKTISGVSKKLEISDIEKAVETSVDSKAYNNEGEIAFFGGSFTAIEREYMISLLEKASEYVEKGLFSGIRISTRPDCISEEILEILKKYHVKAIELGCQSMSDVVLEKNHRGHSSNDVVNSAELIKKSGFEFGVQMMTGLFGDDDETCIDTAKKLIALEPNTTRIYPTIILEGTHLAELMNEGLYRPQTTDEAVNLCSKLLMMFHENGIKVIRLGLHSGGDVAQGYLAGAYHEAFRELCEAEIYFEMVLREISRKEVPTGKIQVEVGSRYVSQFVGQKRSNIIKLNKLGYIVQIVQNNDYGKYKIDVRGARNDTQIT